MSKRKYPIKRLSRELGTVESQSVRYVENGFVRSMANGKRLLIPVVTAAFPALSGEDISGKRIRRICKEGGKLDFVSEIGWQHA